MGFGASSSIISPLSVATPQPHHSRSSITRLSLSFPLPPPYRHQISLSLYRRRQISLFPNTLVSPQHRYCSITKSSGGNGGGGNSGGSGGGDAGDGFGVPEEREDAEVLIVRKDEFYQFIDEMRQAFEKQRLESKGPPPSFLAARNAEMGVALPCLWIIDTATGCFSGYFRSMRDKIERESQPA